MAETNEEKLAMILQAMVADVRAWRDEVEARQMSRRRSSLALYQAYAWLRIGHAYLCADPVAARIGAHVDARRAAASSRHPPESSRSARAQSAAVTPKKRARTLAASAGSVALRN